MNTFHHLCGILNTTESTIDFCRRKNLLSSSYTCCNRQCGQVGNKERSDGMEYKCYSCGKRYSLRTGSFFFNSRLTLVKLVTIIYFFARNLSPTVGKGMVMGDINISSITTWYIYLRQICTTYVTNNPVKLGGPGKVVQMDETCWGRKRKAGRGDVRCQSEHKWIFGMVDVETKLRHIVHVENRNRRTLFPIIAAHVLPNSTVHTDEAAVYTSLANNHGYVHRTVNHSENYVAADGTHTNNIESYWSRLKIELRNKRGMNIDNLQLHLNEIMYRDNRGREGDIFDLLIQDISTSYPV